MELSERKQKILQAIIDEYLGTAEPVGSRVLSKKNELGLSSATIRNEMSDLEGMGFLVQPHTSAGRIPSDSGYRFYVNSLMRRYQMSVEAMERMQSVLEERVLQLEHLIKKASLIAATLTNYTTVVSSPDLESRIQKVDLVHLGGSNVMLIVVTKEGVVKNQLMPIGIDEQTAAGLSIFLQKQLNGMSVNEITFDAIQSMQNEIEQTLKLPPKVLIRILNFVYETIESLDETHFYVENAKSILQYPEYSSIEKAQRMLDFLADEKNLKQLMKPSEDEKNIDVKIGTENGMEELSDCSLVTVNYSIDKKSVGKIGVIGPKRMDYAKVIANLDCISSHIDKILYQLYIGESGG